MPRTIKVRVDDEVYAALERKAAQEGLSVEDYLKREVTGLGTELSMTQWLASLRPKASTVTSESIIHALDEARGEWPDGRS